MIRFLIMVLLFAALPCFANEYKPELFRDELVETTLKDVSGNYPEANLDYDYSNINYVPIKVKFLETISSKGNSEGQIVKFVVTEDIFYNNVKIVSGGTFGKARLETISPRGSMGVPADITISKFEIDGLDKKKFDGNIVKYGANLALLAGGLKYSIGTFIPGSGYVFMLIKGGNVKIKPTEVFEIRYVL